MFVSWWQHWTGPIITLDNGMQVRIGPQLGEGGFSYVFSATLVDDGGGGGNTNHNNHDDDDDDDNHDLEAFKNKQQHAWLRQRYNQQQYALKRIYIGADPEIQQACLEEANVHHAAHHRNLMPLLGFLKTSEYCYMLFPLCSHSLRDEVNRRTGLFSSPRSPQPPPYNNHHKDDDNQDDTAAPWSELQVLQLFLRLCAAVQALHEANYTHRDIKLENVLIMTDDHFNNRAAQQGQRSPNNNKTTSMTRTIMEMQDEPILMDFGSAGPLTRPLSTRQDILSVVELAAQQTTLPYRPPELLDATGVLQVGQILDYRAVDVWSLGCTLFAIMYGASPMECEFLSSSLSSRQFVPPQHRGGSGAGAGAVGRILKIVDCTTLRILNGRLPEPPADSPVAHWYSAELTQDLIPSLLQQDPSMRPSLPTLVSRLVQLIQARGGHVPAHLLPAGTTVVHPNHDQDDNDDDDGFSQFYSSHPV
ncbi:hypothetical protein ACA910_001903 [Epithemia clementina (nom. ined.)]